MQPCPIYVRRGGYQPPVMPDAGPGMAGRRGRRPLRGGANIRRGANPRDVGDAVPYGCETVGFTVGAIHESPFGLPRTRVKALRKPPSPPQGPTSAVMQPCPIYVRRGGYQPPVMPDAGPGMAGRRGRRPLRGGANIGRGANPRDVEDAVPYGAVQISDVVRKLREGQAPPLRARPYRGAGQGDGRRRISAESGAISPLTALTRPAALQSAR